MDRHLSDWKFEIERVWSAHVPDYREAVRLAQHIASDGEDVTLRQAASQALPILRAAAAEEADYATRDAARRRLGVIRDVILTLTAPKFGRRQTTLKSLSPDESNRELLGLPQGRRLSEAEIHRAYKLHAKRAHPDAGGNAEAFLQLTAAHDALMKERRLPPR